MSGQSSSRDHDQRSDAAEPAAPAVVGVEWSDELRAELFRRLREAEIQLRQAKQLAKVGSWIWDLDSDVLTGSVEMAELCGMHVDEQPESPEAARLVIHPDDRDTLEAAVTHTLLTGVPFEADYRVVLPEGGVRWLRARAELAPRAVGETRRLLGVSQNVTEQKQSEDKLTRLALHDPLTGLANRALFVERVSGAIARLQRSGAFVAVLFIDLDRFKMINDTAGHFAGDEVLLTVARRLRQVVRPMDSIARFGGDEFAVLCEDLESTDDAVAVAQRILDHLGQPVDVHDGRSITTRASVGIAVASDLATTAEAMLRDADAAMYQSKEAGRNRFTVFDNDSRRVRRQRLRVADELVGAVERGEFEVFYQPVVDLRRNMSIGVEALVRWHHPERGIIAPDEFIGVAEETGSIVPLGEWVLSEACREAAAQLGPPGMPAPYVAVNLSARQLGQPSLGPALRRAIDETGLDPSRLCLEVTESVLMDDINASTQVLLGLKQLGVRIAVDDFGTGYSSLSYLRRLPVDVVKIDRSFVAGVGVDPADDAIVAAVVNLSHALGFDVVAEGVETEQQLVAVRALGCDHAQGYFWSQPLPPAVLESWSGALGTAAIAAEPVDLYAVLTERTDALRAATGRPVLLQAPPKLAAAVGDMGAVRTILDHLLGNAVTYSPSDRPVVVSAAADRRWVRVSVADFGTGMTPDESARCFEQFWQGDEPSAGRAGTGIGLYIVRSLVETMGGHVGVRSAKGKGSTFTFALPRSARAAARSRVPSGIAPDVGEDSTIREFMRQIGIPNRRGS